MKKSEISSKSDSALARAGKWREEFEKLRAIILDLPLVEEVKRAGLVTRFKRAI